MRSNKKLSDLLGLYRVGCSLEGTKATYEISRQRKDHIGRENLKPRQQRRRGSCIR